MTTINKIARVGILGGLLMGAAALKATNPITNLDKTQNQTEVVSKEGAAALRAMSLQGTQQNSVMHNTKIDNMYRKFASTQAEKNLVNSIIKITYKEKGSALASALLQHELDRQQIFVLLQEDNTTLARVNPKLAKEVKEIGPQFYKSVTPNADKVTKWLDKEYSPTLVQLLNFDHKPTAKEVSNEIDIIAEKRAGFSVDDIIDYHVEIDDFKRRYLDNKTDDMSMSDLIAFKIFTLDKMMIKKSLTNSNFFGKNSLFDNYSGLSVYYNDWMDTVSPRNR